MIVGARPESFEDASLVGDDKGSGHTFKSTIDLVESMGSELYAYFKIDAGDGLQSKELEELAADSGAAEVPGSGTGPGGRPPRRRQQGRARQGGRALARHQGAPLLRARERRPARGRGRRRA